MRKEKMIETMAVGNAFQSVATVIDAHCPKMEFIRIVYDVQKREFEVSIDSWHGHPVLIERDRDLDTALVKIIQRYQIVLEAAHDD